MEQPKLIVFDLDGTLINADSAQEWLSFLSQRNWPGAFRASQACRTIMQCYDTGCMDMHAYMKEWLAPLAGYALSDIEKLAAIFAETVIQPVIFEKGLKQIQKHLKAEDIVLLISASPSIIVKPIAKTLGIRHFLSIDVNTNGNIIRNSTLTPLSFQSGKLTRLIQWQAQKNLSDTPLYKMYSDSVNDIPLLRQAARAVVVNGDDALLKIAQDEGWRIKNWQNLHVSQAANPALAVHEENSQSAVFPSLSDHNI